MHAVIEVTNPREVHIIDVGSASGTFVNGKQINKSLLNDGDELTFGNARVLVNIDTQVNIDAQIPESSETQNLVLRERGRSMADEFEMNENTVVEAVGQSPVGQSPGPGQARSKAPPTENLPPRPPPHVPPTTPPVPQHPATQHLASNPPYISAHPASTPPPQPPGSLGPKFNPFAAPVQGDAFSEGESYQLHGGGLPVSADEVETHDQALEVIIMWGENSVLNVAHLSPPRSFYLGEEAGKQLGDGADFLFGSEVLGADRLPIVLYSGGHAYAVVPPGAQAELTVSGQTYMLAELQAQGKLGPCPELPGAQQFALAPGGSAKIDFKGFSFLVKSVHAGKPVGLGFGPVVSWRDHVWTGLSLALHLAFLLMVYFLPPRATSLSLDLLNQDPRLVDFSLDPEELEKEEIPQTGGDGNEGGQGERHKDEEGQMGKEDSAKTDNHYAIKGPKDNTDPHMAREQAKQEAQNAGVIGVLRQIAGSWNTPTSPYGRDTALGTDDVNALGALMGRQPGDNYGHGGLGLRGTGRGGGGTGLGTLGLGRLGTMGHGAGGGTGQGYGSGAGGLGKRSGKGPPTLRAGIPEASGGLSKEAIRRVVRRHLNEVRFCYEDELRQRPDLDGRVAVRFIISQTGSVQSATIANSTVGSPSVDNCIAQAVRRWAFPSPEGGGVVVVTYPFTLTSADSE